MRTPAAPQPCPPGLAAALARLAAAPASQAPDESDRPGAAAARRQGPGRGAGEVTADDRERCVEHAQAGLLGRCTTAHRPHGARRWTWSASAIGAAATSTETGFDCSGFTRHVFEMSLGLVLPRRADEQATRARARRGQARRTAPRRPRLLQHAEADLLARRHLHRRQPLHPLAATGRERSHRRHELRLLGQAIHRRAPRRDRRRGRSGAAAPVPPLPTDGG